MARIVMAAVAAPRHVFPMLVIAQHLAKQQHQVTVLTGSLFRTQTEASGSQFIAFDPRMDFVTVI